MIIWTPDQLRLVRQLVALEINSVREWLTLPPEHQGSAVERIRKYEEILADIDENLHNQTER